MPAYLCHGFRWQRRSVRVFVIVQNLDDASPEWIIPARSSQCILESFYNLFDFLPYSVPPPRSGSGYGSSRVTLRTGRDSIGVNNSDEESSSHRNGNGTRTRSRSQSASQKSRSQSRTRSRQQSNPPLPSSSAPLNAHGLPAEDELKAQDWSAVKLLEEYDPTKLDEVSRPYAYVADYAVRIDLSASIFDEIARYEERVRSDPDPPMTGPCDEGAAPGPQQSKKKGGKKAAAPPPGTGWFEKLRDQLQRGEEIRWYVVVNGDEVRDWPDEPEGKASNRIGERPKPTRSQQEHHSQYMLQQQIFEDIDKNGKKFSPRSDKEKWEQLAAAQAHAHAAAQPQLKPRKSGDGGQALRPKTPSKGGFRRLFGRSNKGEEVQSP